MFPKQVRGLRARDELIALWVVTRPSGKMQVVAAGHPGVVVVGFAVKIGMEGYKSPSLELDCTFR